MEIDENDGGGQSVLLVEGDTLDEVPDSHRDLITPAIQEAFVNPRGHFRKIARKCPFPKMAAWLRALLKENDWELGLHHGDPAEWTAAGFHWRSSKVFGAEIAPSAGPTPAALPAALQRFYSLVDSIRWLPFGYAGGLSSCKHHEPVSTFGRSYCGTKKETAKAVVFGWALCGDMLIYTEDDRGGWRSHENSQLHVLGTIEETIEWVFAELLANRRPDTDYTWFAKKRTSESDGET
jgi:hypothetical protein